MSNVQRRLKNVEGGTTFSVLLLDTSYLILFLMSNAQRRLKNVEGWYSTKYKVGIRIGIEVLVFKDLACLPQAGY